MKISEVKQEYQLQEWCGMLRQRKESGLTVRDWCQEQGLAEHTYYYRLRKLRQAACTVLEQAQPAQLAEVPLAPKPEESHTKLRLTTKAGTLEILDADCSVLDQVLRAMLSPSSWTGRISCLLILQRSLQILDLAAEDSKGCDLTDAGTVQSLLPWNAVTECQTK